MSLRVSFFTTGENVSSSSMPYCCVNALATRRALKRVVMPSWLVFLVSTYLVSTRFLREGSSFTISKAPISLNDLTSYRIPSSQCDCSGSLLASAWEISRRSNETLVELLRCWLSITVDVEALLESARTHGTTVLNMDSNASA